MFLLLRERFYQRIELSEDSDCWLWTASLNGGAKGGGYGQIRFQGQTYLAHRLSYMIAHGDIPEGLSVLHTCDVSHCVNPKHLFLGTQTDNLVDASLKGRTAVKEQNGNAVLTEAQVSEIRETKAKFPSVTQYDLADTYGVCQATISQVLREVTWK